MNQVERSLGSGEKDYNSVRDKESRAMCFGMVENRLENGVKSYLFEPQFNNQSLYLFHKIAINKNVYHDFMHYISLSS